MSLSTEPNPVDSSRIWPVGLAAVALAVVANLIVRMILFIVLDLPTDFLPLSWPAVAGFTAFGVGAGVVVFALLARRTDRPIRNFWIVAGIFLVLSVIPNLAAMGNPGMFPMPGGTPLSFQALMVFHVVAGAIAIGLLTTLTRKPV